MLTTDGSVMDGQVYVGFRKGCPKQAPWSLWTNYAMLVPRPTQVQYTLGVGSTVKDVYLDTRSRIPVNKVPMWKSLEYNVLEDR